MLRPEGNGGVGGLAAPVGLLERPGSQTVVERGVLHAAGAQGVAERGQAVQIVHTPGVVAKTETSALTSADAAPKITNPLGMDQPILVAASIGDPGSGRDQAGGRQPAVPENPVEGGFGNDGGGLSPDERGEASEEPEYRAVLGILEEVLQEFDRRMILVPFEDRPHPGTKTSDGSMRLSSRNLDPHALVTPDGYFNFIVPGRSEDPIALRDRLRERLEERYEVEDLPREYRGTDTDQMEWRSLAESRDWLWRLTPKRDDIGDKKTESAGGVATREYSEVDGVRDYLADHFSKTRPRGGEGIQHRLTQDELDDLLASTYPETRDTLNQIIERLGAAPEQGRVLTRELLSYPQGNARYPMWRALGAPGDTDNRTARTILDDERTTRRVLAYREKRSVQDPESGWSKSKVVTHWDNSPGGVEVRFLSTEEATTREVAGKTPLEWAIEGENYLGPGESVVVARDGRFYRAGPYDVIVNKKRTEDK